jgi:hypothetical protein
VKALTVQATDAAGRSVSADWWRRDLLAEHPGASALLAAAEDCMCGAGLWHWHGRAAGTAGADS